MAEAARAGRVPQAIGLPQGSAEGLAAAIADFAAPLDPALLLVFASPSAVVPALAETLAPRLPEGCALAGCSSAGELGASGYGNGGVVAVAFPRAGFAAQCVVMEALTSNAVTRWMADLRAARQRLEVGGHQHLLGLVVADGQTRHEDVLAATLDASLPGVPIIGGCAGNGLAFDDVLVLCDGRVLRDAAVFCLLGTDLPLEEFIFQHFTPTGERAVVTAADPDANALLELNAEPAAVEYARLAGLDPARMGPVDFARNPLLLRGGHRHHVRAISGVREDGGLQLLASIDVGTVLTFGRASDLTRGFAEALAALPRRPALILGFDCILRRLALEQAGHQEDVARLHQSYNIWGFNTYGEIHDGMHVNQTFVGVAFYPEDGRRV